MAYVNYIVIFSPRSYYYVSVVLYNQGILELRNTMIGDLGRSHFNSEVRAKDILL